MGSPKDCSTLRWGLREAHSQVGRGRDSYLRVSFWRDVVLVCGDLCVSFKGVALGGCLQGPLLEISSFRSCVAFL